MIMNKCTGIVLCHGDLASGLLSSLQCIFGETDDLIAFTNRNKAIPDLHTDLKKYIDSAQANRVVIFVDLVGGSCWRVAKQLANEVDNVHVFAGVNLPMLVQFLTKIESINNGSDNWISLLLEKSRSAIQGA
jgi:PTS system N-acetylgalactosamine-specific IIA component/PTS system mannose-specific IIA component/PTS system mannose-specific IIB component